MQNKRNNPTGRTNSKRVLAREREYRALELRKRGASFAEIGRQLGIGRSGAYKAVNRGLDRLNNKVEDAAQELQRMRTLEAERLNDMAESIWDAVIEGDTKKMEIMLKLMDRRAKLLGLDQPSGVRIGGEPGNPIQVDDLTEARQKLVEKLEAMAAVVEAQRAQGE